MRIYSILASSTAKEISALRSRRLTDSPNAYRHGLSQQQLHHFEMPSIGGNNELIRINRRAFFQQQLHDSNKTLPVWGNSEAPDSPFRSATTPPPIGLYSWDISFHLTANTMPGTRFLTRGSWSASLTRAICRTASQLPRIACRSPASLLRAATVDFFVE